MTHWVKALRKPSGETIEVELLKPQNKMVIVLDSTGYTFFGSPGADLDPMPRTEYTVVRDDLEAVVDPSDGVYLPAGIYLGGGYVDWVQHIDYPSPTGKITAYIHAENDIDNLLIPEGDLGFSDTGIDISEIGNYILAPTQAFQVVNNGTYRMKVRFNSTDHFTVVRWCFWALQLVDLT